MKTGSFSQTVDRWRRHWLLLLGDAIIEIVAVYAAMLMRFAPILPSGMMEYTTSLLPYIMVSYLGVFFLFGMYKVLWRYADARQMIFLSLANIVGCGVTFLWNMLFESDLSLYYLVIVCALSMAGTCGVRLALRVVSEIYGTHRQKDEFQMDGHRLLIVGAGKAGSYVVSQHREGLSDLGEPIAIVDDDKRKHGMNICGVPILGTIDDIPALAREHSITDIIIAIPSVHGDRLQEIVSICKRTHCYVRLLPDPQNLNEYNPSGRVFTREPEISDFLSRPGMHLNEEKARAFFEGKTVLITGGAGSIGSELCKQLLPLAPKQVILYDINDNYASELQAQLLSDYGPSCPVTIAIGSVRDTARLNHVFEAHHPEIVFHAAAHKHVPLMEYDPGEAVKNNIFGLMNVLDAAKRAGVNTFVQLSSNNAVNPVNVLGATMQTAERITASAKDSAMKCFTVRFGNVLASHGSILPLFVSQIHSGGPVTLTHPDAERYFITLPEAAQLIIEAAATGESGHTYVLEAGAPIKVRELANRLIRFYGLDPETDIPIQVIGLRPGEKMYEEMFTEEEALRLTETENDRINVFPSTLPDTDRLNAVLISLKNTEADEDILSLLRLLVPSFRP